MTIQPADPRQAQPSELQDPRSPYYIRKLHRPKVQWGRVACLFLLPAVIAAALAVLLPQPWRLVGLGSYLLLHTVLALKQTLIQSVLLYQRFAPERVRRKCRFEPSCSEYMLLCLRKYGPIRGAFKGIGRLRRCHLQQGGYDLP